MQIPGMIGELIAKVGIDRACLELIEDESTVIALAMNQIATTTEQAAIIGSACEYHRIKRSLFQYKSHKILRIFTASTEMGWISWTIERGWKEPFVRYIGSSDYDLEPVNARSLAVAREHGWPG